MCKFTKNDVDITKSLKKDRLLIKDKMDKCLKRIIRIMCDKFGLIYGGYHYDNADGYFCERVLLLADEMFMGVKTVYSINGSTTIPFPMLVGNVDYSNYIPRSFLFKDDAEIVDYLDKQIKADKKANSVRQQKEEKERSERESLIKSAKAKLTKAERDVVGI